MPILLDLKDHNILGPTFRKGLKQGMERGLEQGLERGLEQGERRLVLRMLAQRFGELPTAVVKRLDSMSASEIESLSDRILTAATLHDLFGPI